MFEGLFLLIMGLSAAWVLRMFLGGEATDQGKALVDGAPLTVLNGLSKAARRRHLEAAIRSSEAVDPDWIGALSELDPKSAFRYLQYASDAERHDVVAKVCTALLKTNRKHVAAADALLRARLAMGELDRVAKLLDQLPRQEPLFRLLRAQLLFERGDLDGATPLVMGVLQEARSAISHGILDQGGPYWNDVNARADALRTQMLGSVSTEAEMFRAQAQDGELQVRSGANHLLAGRHAMERSSRIARVLQLLPPDMDATDPLRLAEAELRVGSLRLAKKQFLAMVDDDPSYFPAQLGLGAALLREESRSDQLVARWRDLDVDASWWDVLPDLPALSAEERSVVAACIHPLRSVRGSMIDKGARLLFLPIDVRATDRDEMRDLEGHRTGDGRAYAGIGGLAQRRAKGSLACARIEVLLAPAADRTFAHEFAHLAFWHLTDEQKTFFEALYEAARDVPWAWTEYQASNVDEFFAVSYEDWLAERWGVVAKRPDSSGWWQEVCDAFTELAQEDGRSG